MDSDESKLARAAAAAVNWTRELANTRATECNPQYMEDTIRNLVDGSARCKIETINGEELSAKGMHLHYAVGQAATEAPRYVAVTYKGNPDSDDIELALVGKGLTFDTGGLNIK